MEKLTSDAHPHDFQGQIPQLIPYKEVRRLAQIDTPRTVMALVLEWGLIVASIALCERFWNPALYVLTIVFIGARQHALAVLGHDGVHYRLFRNRAINDWTSNLLVFWPLLLTCEGFRYVHSAHHRYLGTERDVQAVAFGMTTKEGLLDEAWKYPKSGPKLLFHLFVKVWSRDFWVSIASLFRIHLYPRWYAIQFFTFVTSLTALLVYEGHWRALFLYWFAARMSWFIISNQIRLICQHSALRGPNGPYGETRTTIPTWLESIFVIPRGITYHIEHHWYPAVPCYNLPKIHALLMQNEEFRKNAQISHGLIEVWRDATNPSPVHFDQMPRRREIAIRA